MDVLLLPPVAFVAYLVLAGMLSALGRTLAGPPSPGALKSSAYASGEEAQATAASPGYKPFFRIALFFAVLHLGALVLASGTFDAGMALYLLGLMVVLVVLAIG